MVPTFVKKDRVVVNKLLYGPQIPLTEWKLPSPIKPEVGDIVVLPTQGFTKLPYDGEEYYVGPENSILAKINKK